MSPCEFFAIDLAATFIMTNESLLPHTPIIVNTLSGSPESPQQLSLPDEFGATGSSYRLSHWCEYPEIESPQQLSLPGEFGATNQIVQLSLNHWPSSYTNASS